MNPLPHGPWLDSPAAHAIGSVEKVLVPAAGEAWAVGCCAGLLAVALPFPLVAFLAVYVFGGAPPGGERPLAILDLFLVAWLLPVLLVMIVGFRRLRVRLLLGARGIARWTPGQSLVVLWDELGTIWWRVGPAMSEKNPLAVVLERQDGTQFPITAFFADYHQVALRVLEELARRTGGNDGATPQPAVTSESITPAERGVIEPGETP
jgi:hypothetical protein